MVTKREIQVVSHETGKIIHRLDVTHKSENESRRIASGMSINLNKSCYFIKLFTEYK